MHQHLKICVTQWTDIFQMDRTWCYKVKASFEVQDMVSDFPLQLNFKKPPLGEFGDTIKKNNLNYLK